MSDKNPKLKSGNLVEKHGFDKVMSAFLSVPAKGKKKKPATQQKPKGRDLKK